MFYTRKCSAFSGQISAPNRKKFPGFFYSLDLEFSSEHIPDAFFFEKLTPTPRRRTLQFVDLGRMGANGDEWGRMGANKIRRAWGRTGRNPHSWLGIKDVLARHETEQYEVA